MTAALIYLEDDLPGLPEDLMLARDQGRVLFLTGAGVSAPARPQRLEFDATGSPRRAVSSVPMSLGNPELSLFTTADPVLKCLA